MNVPFLDLKATYDEMKNDMDVAYQRVMNSGWYLLGQELNAFEKEFAAYTNTKYCVGLGNGLEALELLLKAYDIGLWDEVIVPEGDPPPQATVRLKVEESVELPALSMALTYQVWEPQAMEEVNVLEVEIWLFAFKAPSM